MLLEMAESTWGSAKSCSVPTMEKMQVSTSAGATSGILMFQATRGRVKEQGKHEGENQNDGDWTDAVERPPPQGAVEVGVMHDIQIVAQPVEAGGGRSQS